MTLSLKFILISTLFFVVAFLIENLNGAFALNDFKVYYEATRELLNGGNPYGQAFGLNSGFYKYAPGTLLFFFPATLFNFETAKIIHFTLIAVFSILTFHFCLLFAKKYLHNFKFRETLFLSLLLVFSSVHLIRELHMGNINMLLILLTLSSLYFIEQKRELPAAILLSVLFLLKPYFLIIVLPLLLLRKLKLIFKVTLVMAFLSALPILFFGIDKTLSLHTAWLDSVSGHATDPTSDHTFSAIIENYTGVVLAHYWQTIFIALTGVLFFAFRTNYITKKNVYTSEILIADVFVLIALIPNLVITDSQHFLFSLPLLSLILIHLFLNPDWKSIAAFSILFFFYGMNSNDLLGNPLSNKFDEFSTIGVANILFIGLFFYLKRKGKTTSSSLASQP